MTLVVNEFTSHILDWYTCYILADDIGLVDKNFDEINHKLELWRQIVETKCCVLSGSKTEYIKCKFNSSKRRIEDIGRMDEQQFM